MKSQSENRRLSEIAYDRGDVELPNAPEVFAIEGTNHCNIKCIMCPRGEPDIMTREVGHMELGTFENMLKGAHYFSDVCWVHWFGEPLMNPLIYDYIRLAKTKVPNVGISTNATLLKPAAQEKLLDSGIDTVLIAIDGDSKEVYEAVRKSARFTFEAVTANAEGFLAQRAARGLTKPRVIMSIIVMDKTESDLEDFRQHWQRLGADEILFKPYANWGGQYAEAFDDLPNADMRPMLKSPRPFPCQHLWKNLVIAWNGDVVPCCYDYDAKVVLGNVNEQSLDEIWNGPAYRELRKAEIEGRNNSALCANCSQAPGRPRRRA